MMINEDRTMEGNAPVICSHCPPPHHLPGWVGDSRANVPGSDVLSSPTVPAGERGGSVVECRTPEREVGGSKPTAAV